MKTYFVTLFLSCLFSTQAIGAISGTYSNGSGFLSQITITKSGSGYIFQSCAHYGTILCGANIRVYLQESSPGQYVGDEGSMELNYSGTKCFADVKLRLDHQGDRFYLRAWKPKSVPRTITGQNCPRQGVYKHYWYLDPEPFYKK